MKCAKCKKRIWPWSSEKIYFIERDGVVITDEHYHSHCKITKHPHLNNPKGYNEYYYLKECKCECHNDGLFHVCPKCNCQEFCDELDYRGTELQ